MGTDPRHKVTPADVVETLKRTLPKMDLGDHLTLHHGKCIFPRGCSCIPALSAPLSRC